MDCHRKYTTGPGRLFPTCGNIWKARMETKRTIPASVCSTSAYGIGPSHTEVVATSSMNHKVSQTDSWEQLAFHSFPNRSWGAAVTALHVENLPFLCFDGPQHRKRHRTREQWSPYNETQVTRQANLKQTTSFYPQTKRTSISKVTNKHTTTHSHTQTNERPNDEYTKPNQVTRGAITTKWQDQRSSRRGLFLLVSYNSIPSITEYGR